MPKHSIATSDSGPLRLAPKTKLPFADMTIAVCVLLSCALLFLALPNIISGGGGFWSYIKAFVLSLSAGAVAYGVNRTAIERGAPQAARGYWGAVVVSIGAILTVGFGLFGASYAGLVVHDVEAKRLQQHGSGLAVWVADRVEDAAKAGQAAAAVRSIVDDLTAKRDCERAESCVSGKGNGGTGPVWRALGVLAGRAEAVQRQLIVGESARGAALDSLDAAIADYQRVLADDSTDIWARRGALLTLDARIRQQAAQLAEAMPLALMAAYAEELRAGLVIPDRPEASAALTAITHKHAATLEAVVGSIERSASALPAFPARAGVADTLMLIGDFIPVAAIAAVVEVVFPGTLWLFTYWHLRWEIYRIEAAASAAVRATSKNAGRTTRDTTTPIAPSAPRLITHVTAPDRGDDSEARRRATPRRKRAGVRRITRG